MLIALDLLATGLQAGACPRPATCPLASAAGHQGATVWQVCVGAYLVHDMKRSAACNAVPFEGLPANSRAQPDARPPYLSGLLALRLLAATRMHYVRQWHVITCAHDASSQSGPVLTVSWPCTVVWRVEVSSYEELQLVNL